MTDANKAEAQTELKKVISEAFAAQALWTTDWAAVQLQRCCFCMDFSRYWTDILCDQPATQAHTSAEQSQTKDVRNNILNN